MENARVQVKTQIGEMVSRRGGVLDKQMSAKEQKEANAELKKLKASLKEALDTSKAETDLGKAQKDIKKLLKSQSEVVGKQKAIKGIEEKFKQILELKLSDKSRKLIESQVLQGSGSTETLEIHYAKIIEDLAVLEKKEKRLQAAITDGDTYDIKLNIQTIEDAVSSQLTDEEVKANDT